MKNDVVLAHGALPPAGSWPTLDPFLACMHHDDAYPAGGDDMAPPRASLAGRNIGMDFEGKDGWRMYHGDVVPGFPQHPHRGFETVTVVRQGFVDHADSLGAAARFGEGDVQWITAGKGISHSEMFPLLHKDADNPLELFQIWLNLAHEDKLTDPHFAVLWAADVPVVERDGAVVTVVAGRFDDARSPPSPPPRSWAAAPDHDVAIWTLRLKKGARVTLPPGAPDAHRVVYGFRGGPFVIAGVELGARSVAQLAPDAAAVVENAGDADAELLVLHGKPIGEPVAQAGPFVMTTRLEVQQAFMDYERTRFGGWPWRSDAPVHPRDVRHWARFVDGHEESR